MISDFIQLISAVGSVATAIGVILAWRQLSESRRQSVTTFEDVLAAQYRKIAASLPIQAFFWQELDPEEELKALASFYHYFDLTNEEVFLRQNHRVSDTTWRNWCEGIKSNLERPAFKKAWDQVSERSRTDFDELRRLQASEFRDDPASWQ